MALSNAQIARQPWRSPHWPEKLPNAWTMRAMYGPEADELTIRFPETPNRDIVIVWLATPSIEYAGLMVHEQTGAVVGVQVDYLAGYAVSLHPTWRAIAEPEPSPDAINTIVRDIKTLFGQYGVEGDEVQSE
jgi:hypothetical protein